MNKKNKLLILLFLFIAILIWGLIGSSQVAEVGMTCDFGMGEEGNIFVGQGIKILLEK